MSRIRIIEQDLDSDPDPENGEESGPEGDRVDEDPQQRVHRRQINFNSKVCLKT